MTTRKCICFVSRIFLSNSFVYLVALSNIIFKSHSERWIKRKIPELCIHDVFLFIISLTQFCMVLTLRGALNAKSRTQNWHTWRFTDLYHIVKLWMALFTYIGSKLIVEAEKLISVRWRFVNLIDFETSHYLKYVFMQNISFSEFVGNVLY